MARKDLLDPAKARFISPTNKSITQVPAKPQDSVTIRWRRENGLTSTLARLLSLLKIWATAAIVSFLAMMLIYTAFFGRNKVIPNETIYENYRYVGAPGTTQLVTSEGYGKTSYGQNGLIVDKPLDPDAFRLVFMGDSFVKGKQVSDHEKVTEIIERTWNKNHPGKPIQVLNLGLAGQDMRTYLSFSENVDAHFQPDLVFLVVIGNDFRPLSQSPEHLEQVAQGNFDALVKPQKYNIVEDYINQTGFRSFMGQLQAQTFGFLNQGNQSIETGAGEEETTEVNPEAIAIQLKALQKIWGDRLVIVYRVWIPGLAQNAPAIYEDEVLRELKKQEIPFINLYPPFKEAFDAHQPPHGFHNSIMGQGHWNQYGHQLAATEVLTFLETTAVLGGER